jgi:hypothetical protein
VPREDEKEEGGGARDEGWWRGLKGRGYLQGGCLVDEKGLEEGGGAGLELETDGNRGRSEGWISGRVKG